MRVALLTTFAASKKEPLAEVFRRIHQAFLDAGLGAPALRFAFADALLPGFVSSVDRVLKRYPQLERFVTMDSPLPNVAAPRRITNGPMSPAAGEQVELSILEAIAAGVPRSFPFHHVSFQFDSPAFGDSGAEASKNAETMAGILLMDCWWVNGRTRSLSACTVLNAESGSRKLPALAEPVAAVFAACGKVRKMTQVPLGEPAVAAPLPGLNLPGLGPIASTKPEIAQAVAAIVRDYRTRMNGIVQRAGLPHDLPAPADALREMGLGVVSGPKKPALERIFKPMGYTCRGESGTFNLRRRTAGNLTAELYLDLGTWSNSVTSIFKVHGVGFSATLFIPVSAKATVQAQYPIGDADRWQKIVENLGALAAELDRTFVPEIEAAAGPSPEWFQPAS